LTQRSARPIEIASRYRIREKDASDKFFPPPRGVAWSFGEHLVEGTFICNSSSLRPPPGIGRDTHKMMLDHYQQTNNMLASYSSTSSRSQKSGSNAVALTLGSSTPTNTLCSPRKLIAGRS
jgi:hypothetical protein